jgi:hypothetical protein
MYALTVFTPIQRAHVDELRARVEAFEDGGSPFAELPATHFGRFVIIPDLTNDPSQPHEEHLPVPYLLLSATLDGDRDAYLEAFCALDAAERVYGLCEGAPQPAAGAPLKAYLLHNQIQTGLFFSAYPTATVELVERSLQWRLKAIDLATRGQTMDAAALHAAFLQEFPG